MKIHLLFLNASLLCVNVAVALAQSFEELHWKREKERVSQMEAITEINPFELRRVIANKIAAVEEWEFSYSFGEVERSGSKLSEKTYDKDGNRTYLWLPHAEYTTKYELGRVSESHTIDREARTVRGRPYQTTATFSYDAKGNLLEKRWDNCMTDGVPCADRYKYDLAGNRTEHLFFIGETLSGRTTFAYDTAGKLTAKVTFAKDGTTKQVSYTYDAKGNVTTDDAGTYQYDGLQRIIARTTNDPKATTRYKYDTKGRKIEEVTSSPASTFNGRPLNPAQEVRQLFSYDESGRLVETRTSMRILSTPPFERVDTHSRKYDAAGELVEEAESGINRRVIYRRDKAGNILEIVFMSDKGVPEKVRRYQYRFHP